MRATTFVMAALVDCLAWIVRGARHSEANLLAELNTLPRFIGSEAFSETDVTR